MGPSRNAWATFCPRRHSCPATSRPHKVATQRTFARRLAILWADNHSAKGSLGIVTELVLGGRSMGFSPCSHRSTPLKASVFFEVGAEQECSGYGWGRVPGLKPRLRGGTVGGWHCNSLSLLVSFIFRDVVAPVQPGILMLVNHERPVRCIGRRDAIHERPVSMKTSG